MKKWAIAFAAFALIGSSCLSFLTAIGTYVGDVKIENDTFKNVRTASVEMALFSDEKIGSRTSGFPIFSAVVRTVQEESKGTAKIARMHFKIRAPEDTAKIDAEAFLQIDEQNVKTLALDSEVETKSNTTVTRIPRQRTHVDAFGNTVVVTYEDTTTTTTSWSELTCRLDLDASAISSIPDASVLKVRFYSAGSPITFTFEKKFLDAIQRVVR